MAVKRRNSKTTKAAIATKSTSITVTEPENPARQQQAKPTGKSALRSKKAVKEDTQEVVSILSRQAVAGNQSSAQVLLNLDNKSKPAKPPAKKRTGLTLAQRLALEPPWPGDPTPNLPSSTPPKSTP